MNIEFIEALEEMAKEKGIDREDLYEAIRKGLAVAFQEEFHTEEDVAVEIDEHSGDIVINGQRIELSKFGRIATKKADSSRIEDDVLTAMTDMEDLERETRELNQSIAQIDREHTKESAAIIKETQALDQQVGKLQKGREKAAAQVDPELLQEYERISTKKGASALAAVVSNTCQGCFIQLPPQLGHALRGARQIIRCPSCARILYLP